MIKHLIGARWSDENVGSLPIFNPATGTIIEEVPMAGLKTVESVARAADEASKSWALVPVMERVQLMFKFRELLEEHGDELAQIVSIHHGKTVSEALGEVRRGIEVVEFACGAPTLLQGRTLRHVGRGVDQDLYRYPLGVVAGITPFNFPVMIPLWMFPLAIVTGNTFILKPRSLRYR